MKTIRPVITVVKITIAFNNSAFGALTVPDTAECWAVFLHMIGLRSEQNKIFRPVVQLITVYMMNNFLFCQKAP